VSGTVEAGAHELDQGHAQGILLCKRQHDTGAAFAEHTAGLKNSIL
jgi:hypothetical protein